MIAASGQSNVAMQTPPSNQDSNEGRIPALPISNNGVSNTNNLNSVQSEPSWYKVLRSQPMNNLHQIMQPGVLGGGH
jgi:hypothetical protein